MISSYHFIIVVIEWNNMDRVILICISIKVSLCLFYVMFSQYFLYVCTVTIKSWKCCCLCMLFNIIDHCGDNNICSNHWIVIQASDDDNKRSMTKVDDHEETSMMMRKGWQQGWWWWEVNDNEERSATMMRGQQQWGEVNNDEERLMMRLTTLTRGRWQ